MFFALESVVMNKALCCVNFEEEHESFPIFLNIYFALWLIGDVVSSVK
jgi:hypothetical protein